jgi:plastocyanin
MTKTNPSTRRLAIAFGALIALSAACSGAAPDPGGAAGSGSGSADPATVVIESVSFQPSTITVEPGTTVTWLWDDGPIPHDVKGDGFASELQSSGSFTHTFEEPGTYPYVCSIHPQMTGTVEVEEG